MKDITLDKIRELRPNLDIQDVSKWSKEEWLAYRKTGLGCSEIGAMLDLNEYTEPIILFNQKTGLIRSGVNDNNAMFMGRFMEDRVLELWEYYDIEDGSWESTCYNYEVLKKPLRKAFKPHIYARNPKYPWLFGGQDGVFWHKGDLAVLEIKTISSMAAKRYQNGIPTSYIFQVHAYMLLFETDYCELAMLEDGRDFKVYPIPKDDRIIKMIKEGGDKFWNDIQEAIEILKEKEVTPESDDRLAELEMAYRDLEPEIVVKDYRKFNDFLNPRFKADPEAEIEPSRKISQLVKWHEAAKRKEKAEKVKKEKYAGQIKYFMGEKCKMNTSLYRVSYFPDKNDKRSLRINEINHE